MRHRETSIAAAVPIGDGKGRDDPAALGQRQHGYSAGLGRGRRARVSVGVLTAPSVPPGSFYPVIGQVLAVRDAVATFSRVLGREVRYQEIPDEFWYDGALKRGLDQHAAEHLSQLWRSIRSARPNSATWEPTATIETLGGRMPKTFEEFVLEEQSAFNGFSQ
jgi:uncharacterized protein YbjT (DUF2867 family)